MSEKMNNQTLRTAISKLNKQTNQQYVMNSFDMGDSDKTTYGLVRQNKDGSMDLVLDAKYTKREIYYHIQGFLILSDTPVSTKIKSEEKPKSKKGAGKDE